MPGTIPIRQNATTSAPLDYKLPGAQEIVVRSVLCSIDGSGAGANFLPVLQILAPDGTVVGTYTGVQVTAGASADVNWRRRGTRSREFQETPSRRA